MKRRMPWAEVPERKTEELLDREWLVTNGLGGYASGSVPGVPTRRYHGWLVAAMAAPLGRTMMLDHLSESIALPDGKRLRFGGEERRRSEIETHGLEYLQEFRLDKGLPVWRARFDKWVIERGIVLPHKQNTVYIMYRLVEGEEPVRLRVRPSVHFRGHDMTLGAPLGTQYVVTYADHRCEIRGPQSLPTLRMRTETPSGMLTLDGGSTREIFYRAEADRGYDSVGTLWSPGYFTLELRGDRPACLVASTEDWATMTALSGEQALAPKSAQPRYEAFLDRVPTLIAANARTRSGAALTEAVTLWERAGSLATAARRLSLDPATIVFELAGLLAELARTPGQRAA